MAFWKKSDDPWDVDPEKRKRRQAAWYERNASRDGDAAPAEEGESLKDMLGGLFKKKEEAPIPPEKCPWCGRDMDLGYIAGGRDGAWWQSWKPTAMNIQPGDGQRFSILGEGGFFSDHRKVWYCRPCGKMTMDAPPDAGPNYVWENGQVKLPGTEEKTEET